jgi:hypothetical protein
MDLSYKLHYKNKNAKLIYTDKSIDLSATVALSHLVERSQAKQRRSRGVPFEMLKGVKK